MDTDHDVVEHESSAKRLKLDPDAFNGDVLYTSSDFSAFSNSLACSIDGSEAISADCDSGYEASTLESIPTSSHQTSPHTDSGDIPESLSSLSDIFLTPSRLDQADTSQDSIENDDDNASTVSHLSDLSGISELSGQDWKPIVGSMIWIQKQMQSGVNPRTLLSELGVDQDQVPQYFDDITLWKLIINMFREPPRRNKLRHVNTLDDVVRLIKGAQNIIVLTGAGVSVSCGIPDFRSRDGIYFRLSIDFPNLPDPQAMFDINYFSQDPRPFFKFARDIYPGKFKPSPCHNFIKMLEKNGKLLRNYTQNIDTLEKVASIEKVIECHGSFATATCTKCGHKVTAEAIRETVLSQHIPLCEICHQGKKSVPSSEDQRTNNEQPINYQHLVSSGIMKPDIVFFGEGLPDTFHEAMAEDKNQCDLLLVIGSSLKVRPVALIPNSLPSHVPQILINREPLEHCHFDVELLGDCDVIINHLCHLFGDIWKEGAFDERVLEEAPHLLRLGKSKFENNSQSPDSKDQKLSDSIVDRLSIVVDTKNRTEPNCTEDTLKIEHCSCRDNSSSTKYSSSSASITRDLETISCTCNNLIYNKQTTSIISSNTEIVNSLDVKSVKERHISIDSARDSGIGENSNLTDLENKYDDETPESTPSCFESPSTSDMKGYWEPKIKKSLAERLPPKSFYLIKPSRYVFPGAEIYYDPDDQFGFHDESSSNSSDSDSEDEIDRF